MMMMMMMMLVVCVCMYVVSLCEGLRAGAGSLCYTVHVDCCGLSTIVMKDIIIIIIIIIIMVVVVVLVVLSVSCCDRLTMISVCALFLPLKTWLHHPLLHLNSSTSALLPFVSLFN